MKKYRLKWFQWADGGWTVTIYLNSDNSLVAAHGGDRGYLERIIKRRGYNQ